MNLVFVYNADSGLFNTLSDIAHKLLSPNTYQCNLCNLTHSYFSAREEWLVFLKDLDSDIEFLHRDEYLNRYVADEQPAVDLPAIFIKQGEQLIPWIDKKVIDEMKSTDELMEMIRAAVLKEKSGIRINRLDELSSLTAA